MLGCSTRLHSLTKLKCQLLKPSPLASFSDQVAIKAVASLRAGAETEVSVPANLRRHVAAAQKLLAWETPERLASGVDVRLLSWECRSPTSFVCRGLAQSETDGGAPPSCLMYIEDSRFWYGITCVIPWLAAKPPSLRWRPIRHEPGMAWPDLPLLTCISCPPLPISAMPARLDLHDPLVSCVEANVQAPELIL